APPPFSTRWACSKTSPSRQPPLTEPAIRPERLIAIRDPAGRGALPQVLITVARATGSSSLSHKTTSAITSRIWEESSPTGSGPNRPGGLAADRTAVVSPEQQPAQR